MYPESFPTKRFEARARLSIYKKRLAKSIEVIKESLALGIRWYSTCSCGKDSVVLSHLVNQLQPGIEVWSEKDSFDFPGEKEYLQNLGRLYGWNLNIVTPVGDLDAAAKEIDLCEDLHSHGTSFSDSFFYSLVEEQEERFDGVFLGLRIEESQGRRKNFRRRGHIYQRKNGKYTCIPLACWETEDIFAYLVSNKIPILPVYFNTKFFDGDPCQIRKSWYLPSARASSGHVAWLRYYYPELYQKLLLIDRSISTYC